MLIHSGVFRYVKTTFNKKGHDFIIKNVKCYNYIKNGSYCQVL